MTFDQDALAREVASEAEGPLAIYDGNRDGDGTLISDLTQTRTASHSRKIPSELGIRYT